MSVCNSEIKKLGLTDDEVKHIKDIVKTKKDAVDKIKELKKELEPGVPNPDTRKYIAELNKIKNSVKDDYERLAKKYLTDNPGTVRRAVLQDRMANGSISAQDILTNYGSVKGDDNIYTQNNLYQVNTFNHFSNLLKDDNISQDVKEAFENVNKLRSEDPNKFKQKNNDYDNDIEKIANYYKSYINNQHMMLRGEEYFKDDDEITMFDNEKIRNLGNNYSIKENLNTLRGKRDSLRNSLNTFKTDLLDNIDHDKFIEQVLPKVYRDASETGSESDLGAYRDLNRDKGAEFLLDKWINAVVNENEEPFSIYKLPFKDKQAYKTILNKYGSSNDIQMNYHDFTVNKFSKTYATYKLFGGRPFWSTMPSEAFTTKFDKQKAKDYYETFMNQGTGLNASTEKQLSILKGLDTVKSALSASKVLLPMWSFADNATSIFRHYTDTYDLSMMSGYQKLANRWVSDITNGVRTFKDKGIDWGKGIGTGVEDLKKINHLKNRFGFKSMGEASQFYRTTETLMNAFKGMADYQSIKAYGELTNMKSTGFTGAFDGINKVFLHNAYKNQDETQKIASWRTMIDSVNRYNYGEKGLVLFDRLKTMGINEDDYNQIKKLIGTTNLKDGVIEDVEDEALKHKLYILRHNTDIKGVVNDVTSYQVAKANPVIRSATNYMLGFTLKSTTALLDTLAQQPTLMGKLGTTGIYMLMQLPSNLVITSLADMLYGQNPFQDSKTTAETLLSSMAGAIYRPASFLAAMAMNDKYQAMNSLSNPLLTASTKITSDIGKLSYSTLTCQGSEQQKAFNNLFKHLLTMTPVIGQPTSILYARQNS